MTQSRVDAIEESINAVIEDVKSFGRQARERIPAGALVPDGAYETEKYVFGELLKVGRLIMELYFDEVGNGDRGFRHLHEGKELTRKIEKPVTLLTVFGRISIERWLYYLSGYVGYSVTEDTTNLPDREASHFLQRVVGRIGIRDTFEETEGFLEELFGLSMSSHTVHEIIGELAQDHVPFADEVTPEEPQADEVIQAISFDGKGVPIIKDVPTKPQARLKKGEKRDKKKEAIVGLEYVTKPKVRSAELVARALVMPEDLTEEERARIRSFRQPNQSIYYQGSIQAGKAGIMQEIAERVESRRKVSPHPLRQCCLIDGSHALINAAAEKFPDAVHILDIIHVSERFWLAAHVFHEENSTEAKEMVYDLTLRTLRGEIGSVIGGLRQRATKNADKLSSNDTARLNAAIKYLESHRQIMRYNDYLADGFPIATGVVESACGHLVKDRMEKAGARWCINGAEAMLRLRSIYASGNWEDYLEYHRRQEHNRLYRLPYAAAA
jgi:hypothetical protein